MKVSYPIVPSRTICTRAIPEKSTFVGVIEGKRSLYLKTIERIVDLESSVVKDGRTYEVTEYQPASVNIQVDFADNDWR